MSKRLRHLALAAALSAAFVGCNQAGNQPAAPAPAGVPIGQRPLATPDPEPLPAPVTVATPVPIPVPPAPVTVATPVPTPVPPAPVTVATPVPTAEPPTPAEPAPAVSSKLSFDVFGRHKEYDRVIATTGTNEQGQEITTIEAFDGDNTLKLVVEGSGPGEHKMLRAELKDELLGDQPYVLDASQPNIAGKVTFTEFDAVSGKIAGSFEAGYKGFPPVTVQNGTLIAVHQEPANESLMVAGR